MAEKYEEEVIRVNKWRTLYTVVGKKLSINITDIQLEGGDSVGRSYRIRKSRGGVKYGEEALVPFTQEVKIYKATKTIPWGSIQLKLVVNEEYQDTLEGPAYRIRYQVKTGKDVD